MTRLAWAKKTGAQTVLQKLSTEEKKCAQRGES